jgi:hypothetical protein
MSITYLSYEDVVPAHESFDGEVQDELNDLKSTISTLDGCFGRVEAGLANFDSARLPDTVGNVTDWYPQWKTIQFVMYFRLAARISYTR